MRLVRSTNLPGICVWFFLFLLTIALYANTLRYDFIFEDDIIIIHNQYLKDIPSFIKVVTRHFLKFQAQQSANTILYYTGFFARPLLVFSYALDYFFWKLNPFGFHLTNILIHSTNAFLLYLVVYLLWQNSSLGLLAGIFFCIHPIQVCNVVYISHRAILLEMLFMLACALGFMLFLNRHKKSYYLLSLALFMLAILSREGALILPLLFIMSAWVKQTPFKKLFFYLCPYIAIGAIYLAWRSSFLPSEKLVLTDAFSLQGLHNYALSLQGFFMQYVLPVDTTPLGLLQAPFFRYIYLFICAALGFVLVKMIVLGERTVLFGVGFYLAGMLPLVKLADEVRILGPVLSELFLYTSAAGFCILLAYLAMRLLQAAPRTCLGITALLIFVFSGLSIFRARFYKDDLTFYRYVLRQDPRNLVIRINLGNLYLAAGNYDEALRQARFVVAHEAGAWDAYLLLGNVSREKEDLGSALVFFRQAAGLNPASALPLNNIALIYRAQGRDEEALKNFQKALDLEPESALIVNNFMDFLIQKKSYVQAMELSRRALKVNPRDADAWVKRGILLAETGYAREAEGAFLKALKISPDFVEAMKNLGVLYGNSGDFDKAIAIWQRALRLKSGDKGILRNIEEAKRLQGR